MTREDAIDVLKHNYPSACFAELCEAVEIAIQALSETIEPEQKKGKWDIRYNPGTGWYRAVCSECGEDVTSVLPMLGFFPDVKPLWDFCPNCGADMRGEQS